MTCSTPSGIMESVTRRRRSRVRRVETVLNAFRHHGIGHNELGSLWKRNFRCSTPSGIMESVTGNGKWIWLEVMWCSTPSGIMESVTSTAMAASSPWVSAQRLPASWNRSLQ